MAGPPIILAQKVVGLSSMDDLIKEEKPRERRGVCRLPLVYMLSPRGVSVSQAFTRFLTHGISHQSFPTHWVPGCGLVLVKNILTKQLCPLSWN